MIDGQGYGPTATPLSDRLDSLRPPSMPTLPSFVALERRIQQVLDRYDAPANPPEREAERLFSEMRRRIIESDWHKVPMSFTTRVASSVFSAAHVLRNDLTLLREFITAEVRASDRPGFLNPMIRIYMESYATGAQHTADLANALSIARPHIGARWQPMLTSLPDLLLPDLAAKSIARIMNDMDDPWHGLRAKGLRQPHAPGLMDAAHLAFVDTIRPRLRDRKEIDRLLVWLRPDGQALRQVGAGVAITALLQAWADRDPPNEIKGLLIDRLTEFYGHPRVNRHPAWNEVDPAHELTFLRWLMGADIRFLFRILTEVERGHMWADREAFWWTLFEQGRIDEVWIAFNEAGHRVAMSRLPVDARQSGRRFGKQTGERDKSLLIMRIGNRVVVEGTYSFMVHAFDAQNSVAPALYKNTYDVADIRNRRGALWKVVHNGNWQDKVMRML